MSVILEVSNLNKHFGGLHVLKNIDFKLSKGEIVGILGPNGAGKTTVLKAITLMVTLFVVCRANLNGFIRLQGAPLMDALAGGADLFLTSALTLAGVIAAFALIDVPIQWMTFMREQRMSKRDIKDEMKQSEGKPEVKSRIRQIQRQMARSGSA